MERKGFSTSLDRFTSALQINSNARSGFQAFVVIQMKAMMDNYGKTFWNIFWITTSASEFACQLLQSFLQAFSFSEGVTNAELGWAVAGKLCFQAVFLLSPRNLLGDLQQANHIPFPCQSFQFQNRGNLSLLKRTLRPTDDKRNNTYEVGIITTSLLCYRKSHADQTSRKGGYN